MVTKDAGVPGQEAEPTPQTDESKQCIAAAFGLTPSLFTNTIQKEADQYKTDLKSTAAPTGEKQKNSY